MRLPVPGPRDLLSVLERGAGSVEQLLAAVPRMTALLGEAELLLVRVNGTVDDIERTVSDAGAVVARTNEVVDRAEATVTRTDTVLTAVLPLVERLRALLDSTEPSLTKLQPTLERLADTTDPREVDAMVQVVDQLPRIADRLETDIMPILDSLNSVSPDLHELLEVSRDLNQMMSQIPGLSWMRARSEKQQSEDDPG